MIEFNPVLRAIDVYVPESVSLVIANSLTPSPKLLTVGTRYNKRVVECRFGLLIMALKLGKGATFEEITFKNFFDLQTNLGFTFEQMLELANQNLKKGGYSIEDIKKALRVDDLSQVLKDIPHFSEVLSQNKSFMLWERAAHVFSEAHRVYQFKATCDDDGVSEEDKVTRLGRLMNESHQSCKDLYECSSE